MGYKKIELPIHMILIQVTTDDTVTGSITCDPSLYQTCPVIAIDGILSMILVHTLAGIDVESPEYLSGVETAFSSICDDAK